MRYDIRKIGQWIDQTGVLVTSLLDIDGVYVVYRPFIAQELKTNPSPSERFMAFTVFSEAQNWLREMGYDVPSEDDVWEGAE